MSVISKKWNANVSGIAVENGYLEEKGDALTSLCELTENLGTHFVPYYEDTFGYGLKLVDFNALQVISSYLAFK